MNIMNILCIRCGEPLGLVVDEDNGKLMALCHRCNKLYEIMTLEITPEDLEVLKEWQTPIKEERLFYLVCQASQLPSISP